MHFQISIANGRTRIHNIEERSSERVIFICVVRKRSVSSERPAALSPKAAFKCQLPATLVFSPLVRRENARIYTYTLLAHFNFPSGIFETYSNENA